MFNLIKADLYRIFTGKLLLKTSLLLIALSTWNIWRVEGKSAQAVVIEQVDLASGYLPLFFLTIFLMLWNVEFNQRTVNHALVFGISRRRFFISKFLTGSLLIIYLLTSYFSITLIGSLYLFKTLPILTLIKLLAYQLPLYITILALGFCLFSLMDQPYFPIVLLILIAFLGENILGSLVYDYLPDYFEQLQYTFVFNNLSQVLHVEQLNQTNLSIIYGSAGIFSLILIGLTYFMFQQRELK